MNSHLQIISGKYRGRKLAMPPDARPTQNRARIALFNMLTPMISQNIVVWDAFAGSGAFGIEFLSRNAASTVIFTDNASESIKTVRKNLTGIDGNAIIRLGDAIAAADEFGKAADIVFIDPPYDKPKLGENLVEKLAIIAKPGTIIVWETETTYNPTIPKNMTIIKDKTYGRARLLILNHAST
ncbi:MAG: RsmD family RNA methyltransferase [Alphaproteobacteria bacterium]|nr:RsmD family RNA methyltransferase [Alphaproteobacteria bacterium]